MEFSVFHFYQFSICSVTNGKYMDELKYSNMHTVASLDDPKYQNCHIENHSIKTLDASQTAQQYPTTTTNLTTVGGGCHTDDGNDNNSMAVIKSEDSNQTHSYVLPPFLH